MENILLYFISRLLQKQVSRENFSNRLFRDYLTNKKARASWSVWERALGRNSCVWALWEHLQGKLKDPHADSALGFFQGIKNSLKVSILWKQDIAVSVHRCTWLHYLKVTNCSERQMKSKTSILEILPGWWCSEVTAIKILKFLGITTLISVVKIVTICC